MSDFQNWWDVTGCRGNYATQEDAARAAFEAGARQARQIGCQCSPDAVHVLCETDRDGVYLVPIDRVCMAEVTVSPIRGMPLFAKEKRQYQHIVDEFNRS